jgi:integration host factor subunit beta
MLRSELVTRIAAQNPHLFEREVEAVVNAILDRIAGALADGTGSNCGASAAFPRRPVHRDGRVIHAPARPCH